MKFILSFLIFASSTTIFANDKGGNGGGGHICPKSVEVYDLYEGRERFGLTIISQDTLTVEETLNFALSKVKEQHFRLSFLIEKSIKEVRAKLRVRDILIERTLDADNLFHDPGCDYQQIANWDSAIDQILVSKSIWDRMNDFQKGVLIFHEAAYKVYRSLNTNDGVQTTRRFISEVFSNGPIKTQLVPYPNTNGGFRAVTTPMPLGSEATIGLSFVPQKPNCKSDYNEITLELDEYMTKPMNIKMYNISEMLYPSIAKYTNGVKFETKLTPKNRVANPQIQFPFYIWASRCQIVCPSDYESAYKPIILSVKRSACGEVHKIIINRDTSYVFFGQK